MGVAAADVPVIFRSSLGLRRNRCYDDAGMTQLRALRAGSAALLRVFAQEEIVCHSRYCAPTAQKHRKLEHIVASQQCRHAQSSSSGR